MKKNQYKLLIIIFITSLATLVSYKAGDETPLINDKLSKFPLSIGEWRGEEIPMGQYVYDSLETPYLFLRDYVSKRYSRPVNLSVVWFDDRVIAFHAPEACLGGIGNRVISKDKIQVKLDKEYVLNKLIVENDGVKRIVLYFFDMDGHVTLSQGDIRLRVLAERLKFKRSSVSFIRLMASITPDENEEAATEKMIDFLKTIYPVFPDYLYTDRIGAVKT